MVAEEKKLQIQAQIQTGAENDEEFIQALDLEELLYLARTCQKQGRPVQRGLYSRLISFAAAHTDWYMLVTESNDLPFSQNGRAFLFTDETTAQNALQAYRDAGMHLRLETLDVCDESPFQRFARYGIEFASINKGGDSLVLKVHDAVGDYVRKNVQMNNLILRLTLAVDGNSREELDGISEQLRSEFAAPSTEFFYLMDESGIPALEEMVSGDGENQICMFLFTDRTEMSLVYPDSDAKRSKIHLDKIAGAFQDAGNLVVNPATAQFLITPGSFWLERD